MPPLLGKETEDLLFVSCSVSISQSVKWWNACQHWCLFFIVHKMLQTVTQLQPWSCSEILGALCHWTNIS